MVQIMAIANDLHTLFEARREAFLILDGQPTDAVHDLECLAPRFKQRVEVIGNSHDLDHPT